jgi:hypothetical protein
MRLFLHLYNRQADTPDEDGAEYEDLDAAYADAVRGIRSVLAEEVMTRGLLDLDGRLEIADEHGQVMRVIPFSEAVAVSGP